MLQDAGAEANYHEAQRAYETLSDKDKRQMYDQVTRGGVPIAHPCMWPESHRLAPACSPGSQQHSQAR